MRIERQFVFWTSALLVFIGVLLLLRHILLPFVVGAALAYLLDPLANLLIRRGINRLVAALLIIALFVIVFAGILVVIAPVLVDQLAALIGKLPGYLERLQALVADPSHSWLIKIMGGTSGGNQGSLGVLMNKLVGYLTDMLSTLWTKGEALLSLLSLFVITPVVTFYLLVDWDRVVSSLDSLVPLPQRQTVHELMAEINKALSGYVRGQLLVCAILGVYYAIGLTLAGLSFGLLIGVVSGFLTFIPYVGSLTALVVSFAVAVAQFYPDWTRILIVARRGSRGPIPGRQRAVAETRRRQRGIASGLADLCVAGLRLLLRLCRPAAGRAARRGDRRADAVCRRALSLERLLYRKRADLSAMSQRPRQLALALDHAESYAREDFLVGPCNEGPFQLICSWPDWPANALALVGPEGSGKTHLAMIWAAMAGARIVSARGLA